MVRPSVVSALLSLVSAPVAAPHDLTILHTNDLHGHVKPWGEAGATRGGIARIATLVGEVEAANAGLGVATLLLDAGDQREGTLFYDLDRGRSFWQLMEAAGYDVVQVGNHDHLFGVQALYDDLAAAFPGFGQGLRFLWGNVNPLTLDSTGTLPQLQVTPAAIAAFENAFADVAGTVDPGLLDPPFANSKVFNQTLFFQAGAVRVGVFGLDTDELLYTQTVAVPSLSGDPSGGEHLTFYDPVAHPFASAMVAYLDDPDGDPGTDDGADVIVATTHLGVGADLLLAASAAAPNGRRIDVIVGGHSHTRLNTAIPVPHPGGRTTWIVQAGSYGEFLGRVDLAVDTATNAVSLVSASLLEVDASVAEEPNVAALVATIESAPGGVNATFGNPYSTVVGDVDALFVPGLLAPSAMGNLVADAARWKLAATPFPVDFAIAVPFVQRQALFEGMVTAGAVQEVLPLHDLGTDPVATVRAHRITLPGGLVNAPSLHDLLALIPGTNPPDFQNVTRLELFLEAIFSLEDFLDGLGPILGFQTVEVGPFLKGIGWSGISFVVDPAGPIFERIEPASISIGGVPWVGNEGTTLHLSLDSVVAKLVGPFLGGLIEVESPPNSGNLGPIFAYDPVANDTGTEGWQALRDYFAFLGAVGAIFEPMGDRVRTVSPDLTILPSQASIYPPTAVAGQPLAVVVPVSNLGETAVLSAVAQFSYDPTPGIHNDDPDGWTDGITGAAWPLLASLPVGLVPGHDGVSPGSTNVSFVWDVPRGLAPGNYRIFPRLTSVVSADPLRPEVTSANNAGAALSFRIVAGPTLRLRGDLSPGGAALVEVDAREGDCYCVFLAAAPDSLVVPGIGNLLIDLGQSMPLLLGAIPPGGTAANSIPIAPGASGFVFFVQGVTYSPAAARIALTNRVGPTLLP